MMMSPVKMRYMSAKLVFQWTLVLCTIASVYSHRWNQLNGGGNRLRRNNNEIENFFESVNTQSNGDRWDGKWFPSKPQGQSKIQKDEHDRIKMGVSNAYCDDAKTNLTTDWDQYVGDYVCFHPDRRYPDSQPFENGLYECEYLPQSYMPLHFCMNETLSYKEAIPTYGDHRPLWPKFGEYQYVPPQRWLHNIEHGAVVMLYHPCAYPSEVEALRKIVTGCIGKHVITPSTRLDPKRPLALVAWGCRIQFSIVNEESARQFIIEHGMKGPEGNYAKEGQYDFGLIKSAQKVGNGLKYGYSKIACVVDQ